MVSKTEEETSKALQMKEDTWEHSDFQWEMSI